MKKIIFLTFVLSVLLLNPYTMSRYIRPLFAGDPVKKPAPEKEFAYTPDRQVKILGSSLILYDGRNLRKWDETGKEVFVAPIRSDNFALETMDENIYLLDKVRKKIYSFNDQGEILAQVEVKETPMNIKAITGGRFILHYITEVKVEGLQIYDKKCKLLNDITYPKRSINFIQEDKGKNGFMVSSLIRTPLALNNSIYLYNNRLDPTMATDVEDTVFVKGELLADHIALMDTSYMAIYDRSFRPLCRISAEGGFRDFLMTTDGFYTVGSGKKIRNYDFNGKLLEEKTYKEEILSLKMFQGEPLVIFRGGYIYQEVHYDTVKDILDVFPLDNKLAILFKDSIKFVEVP